MYKKNDPSELTYGSPMISGLFKLLVSPEVEIKAGSVIKVTKHDESVERYKSSGKMARYVGHNEIEIFLEDEYA